MPMTGEENERREEKKRKSDKVSQWDILKGSGRAKVAKT